VNRRRVISVAALIVAGAAIAWALVLSTYGGFDFRLLGATVTTNEPLRPLALAALALAVFAASHGTARTEAYLAAVSARVPARVVALALATAVTLGGIVYNTTAASASDQYGYVSQADLWLEGQLHVPQPWAAAVPWPSKRWSFSPLGYRPVEAEGRWENVPTYSPGLPILMAGAKRLAGQEAMFLIVPLFGGVMVLATWGIGCRLGDPAAGAIAAWLVATSPAFLLHLVVPMSDVAAAGAWTAAVFLILRPGPGWAAASGVMAGVALLIRPNLLPLAAIVGAYAVLRRLPVGAGWRSRLACGIAFGTPVVAAAAAIGAIYQSLYGSPFVSGYGRTSDFFAWSHVGPNLRNYLRWFLETQSVVGLVGLAAVFVPVRRLWPGVRDRRALAMVAAIVFTTWAQYVAYLVFDNFRYLRFLFVAWPFVMLGIGAATLVVIRLNRPVLTLGVTGLVLGLGLVGWRHAAREGAFNAWQSDRRFVAAGLLVRDATPSNSAVLTMIHSGSLRYYGGRMTIRYDMLDRDWLDRGVAWLNDRGVRVYALLEDWEIESFTSRFSDERLAQSVAGPPLLEYRSGSAPVIRLYDFAPPDADGSGRRPIVVSGTLDQVRSRPPAPVPALVFAP